MRNITISFVFIVIFTFLASVALAGGPWKGQVMDIETKEPIEGAVVVAVWIKAWRTPAGDNTYVFEVKETLTNKEGAFEMPSYIPINLLPILTYIRKPYFIIFKPGYLSIEWHHEEYFLEDAKAKAVELPERGKVFRAAPGIIELPRLKTREEIRRNLPSLPSWDKFLEKQKNLIRLINEEEENLEFLKSVPIKAREFFLKEKGK